MKKITINSETRQLSQASTTVGYLQENKVEKLEFEIPEEYKTYGRKACFKAQDKTFAKIFDDITGNTLTLTRDMTQYDELEMSIAFFKTENEDEIVARTSILKIYIENAIICDDDIQPDDPKVVILDELIQKVTKLNDQVTKDEETRQNQEATRQQNETVREENEQGRVFDELGRKKVEEERKTNELERITNENERKTNEEQRIVNENKRVSNENAREEYINNFKTRVDNGDFDGADFNYKWDGTKLGVKNSKETTYQYVELKGQKGDKGEKGDKGDTGNGIQNIEKVSTVENVDTYAIHYTDGTQTTFDVTNGEVTKEQLDEVDSKAKKTRNELERVKNDILETGTASDSFINVQDSAWAELQELSVDGVLSQETTNGYQLFDVSKVTEISNGTIENEIVTSNALNRDGQGVTYKFPSITLVANTTYYIFADIRIKSGTGSVNGINNGVVGWEKVSFPSLSNNYNTFISKYTPTENEKIYAVYLGFNNAIDLIINIQNVMITTDRNATYEPYTGGQPSPSPDYPEEIRTITDNFSLTSCNKNIFDFEKLKRDNSLSEISGNSVDFTIKTKDVICLLKFPILIDNLYINFKISSNKMNGSIKVVYEDDTLDTIYEKYDNSAISDVNVSKLFNKNKKIKGIRILTFGAITYFQIKGMLLAISSTATSFEEHLQSQITVNLPEGEFIGKLNETNKDELKAVYNQEEGQYHLILNKKLRHFRLPISEMNNTDKFPGWNGQIIQQIDSDFPLVDNSLSEYTNYISTATNKKNTYRVNSLRPGRPTLYINSNIMFGSIITQTEIKEKYSDLIIDLYYVIPQNNQYTIDLGVIDIPLSYNEVTNIFTDSDLLPQINAKYYRNFVKTVQNLQVNEKALKQELIDINNRLTALETAKASESEVNNDIPVE